MWIFFHEKSNYLIILATLNLSGKIQIPAWIYNRIHYKVWVKITYPFSNLNGGAVDVREWTSNFIPYFTGHVITYPWSKEAHTKSIFGLDNEHCKNLFLTFLQNTFHFNWFEAQNILQITTLLQIKQSCFYIVPFPQWYMKMSWLTCIVFMNWQIIFKNWWKNHPRYLNHGYQTSNFQ